MKNKLTLIALIALGSFLNSCDSEDVVKAIDCTQKAKDYNDSRLALVAYFSAIDEGTKEFTCSEFSPIWNAFDEDFDELCTESLTSDLVESVKEVTDAAALVNNLEGCDIDFD
ncbi:MAG: hypothetical protein AB8B73_05720 [Ekhidna sp.]